MKNLKFFLFLAIILAVVSFVSCDPINPPSPDPAKPDPNAPVVAADSVVIQVTFVVPVGTILGDVQVNVWNSTFTNGVLWNNIDYDGVLMMIISGEGLVKTIVFKDDQAKALIGQVCDIDAGIREASYNGRGWTFNRVTPGKKTITIQKGLNQLSFDFKARD